MSDRGVLLLCFDVPAGTKADAKAYRKVRKILKGEGFVQLQESVYVKLLRHYASRRTEADKLKTLLPKIGSILLIPLHLGELNEITTISGKNFDLSFFSDDFIAV